ncbi:hypothetical protein SK128_000906, partial [Halocaridina rubra]
MEMNQSAASVSFGKKNGCYLNRGVLVLLGLLFISAIVATGLIVYYYAPQVRDTQKEELSTLPKTSSDIENPLVTTASPVTPPKKEKRDIRLPRSIKPLHYVVKLQPFINGNFSIMGYVQIEMEVLEPTKNISLHILDIITKNETIKLLPSNSLEGPGLGIDRHAYDPVRQFYIAHLARPLERGKKYVLSMNFEGHLNDQLHGFYRSSYEDAKGEKVLLACTQFQPTDARRAFPCFDEPGLKATFEIYLGRTENMSSISNMPIYETFP